MNTNDLLFTTVLGANILIKSNLLYRIFNILKFGKWYKTHVRFNKKRFLTNCLVSRVSDPEEAYASDVAKACVHKDFHLCNLLRQFGPIFRVLASERGLSCSGKRPFSFRSLMRVQKIENTGYKSVIKEDNRGTGKDNKPS